MPIRFRCEHCNQRLGIARRRAGTKVECPTCHALVLVPHEDQEEAPAGAPGSLPRSSSPNPEAPLFERSDFDELLQGRTGEEPSLKVPTVGQQPLPPLQFGESHTRNAGSGGGYDVERVGGAGADFSPAASTRNGPSGYVLTPYRASLLTTIVIVLMAVSFVAGLLVGRFL